MTLVLAGVFLVDYLRFPWSSEGLVLVDTLSVKKLTTAKSWHIHFVGQYRICIYRSYLLTSC